MDMRKEDSPYWVNITLEDEEAEDKVRDAIEACRMVHQWAMLEMRELWTYSNDKRVNYNDLAVRMTQQIKGLGVAGKAQRFSLATALSRAVGRFNQEMEVVLVGSSQAQVTFPDLYMPREYEILDIQSRSIWSNYMAYYNFFSTHYGGMYLTEKGWWEKIIRQATKEGVKYDHIYYLIYSATIREGEEGWQVHFNLHKPQSVNGKKRLERA